VVVDRAGREQGRAISGSSNYTVVGAEEAAEQIRRAVTEATQLAEAELPLRAIWVGRSGVDRPGARARLLPLLRPLAVDTRLTNDAELVFGALEGSVGVVLIAGTGSIALGRDTAGATVRAGGWGHLIGDEGSGYDLGRRALQASARAADGRGPHTDLLDAVVSQWQLEHPMEIIGKVYGTGDKAEIAALSSLVFAAARNGDAVARQIVADAASELAQAVIAVGGRIAVPNGGLPLALAGGLLTGESKFRAMVLRRVKRMQSVGQVSVVHDQALTAARSLIDPARAGRWHPGQ
jgi:N-acetylglucosamine kinase-like BadF-type ATPase